MYKKSVERGKDGVCNRTRRERRFNKRKERGQKRCRGKLVDIYVVWIVTLDNGGKHYVK